MAFIRNIKKGGYTYLAEVENKWVNGKVVQKHLRYVGRKLNGRNIYSGSIENIEVTKVSTWAPLLVLNTLARQIHLSEILGDYGGYLLSLAYAHCLEPKSVNKMEEWFKRTDLHNMLSINEVSEKKLYHALDSVCGKKLELTQKKIFNAVKLGYNLYPKGYFFDVTNVYFYGTECSIGKKGKNKEGGYKPQIQIGLAVTQAEGIPIFHKTFEGNIFDSRVLQDMLVGFHDLNIQDVTLIWDRGVSSADNITDAKRAGFNVICGLAIKKNIKPIVDSLIEKREIVKLKNRIRLQSAVLYCVRQKFRYRENSGQLILCFNEKTARTNKEKRIDNLCKAKEILDEGKAIPSGVKKYFKNKDINEKALLQAQKYDGYSVIFSTKKLTIEETVKAYFEKDVVEKAFRSLKSILGLKPIRHWLEERVTAHVFICYLSYLLFSLLEYKLKPKGISALAALEKLNTAYKVHIKNKKLKNEFTKTVTLTKEQETIMKAVDKRILKPSV